jgi:hypothetical protein
VYVCMYMCVYTRLYVMMNEWSGQTLWANERMGGEHALTQTNKQPGQIHRTVNVKLSPLLN